MSDSLPPGQRESKIFPRFGLTPFAKRFPRESVARLKITGAVTNELNLVDVLKDLPRTEQLSDFHCVTTWSARGLRWGGVRFADFYSNIVVPQAKPQTDATLVAMRAQDGARTALPLKDLLASDVLLADTLNGEPLDVDHGAPLRLVAPAHYGYKSVKYLSELEFRPPSLNYRVSGPSFMDHPRARVALEERGRVASGWLLRYLYRPLIGSTVKLFAKESAKYKAANANNTEANTQ
ncbi:MAG: molybdopterin-dependent oxidoreductase [Gammaproteobacteria bacterium]